MANEHSESDFEKRSYTSYMGLEPAPARRFYNPALVTGLCTGVLLIATFVSSNFLIRTNRDFALKILLFIGGVGSAASISLAFNEQAARANAQRSSLIAANAVKTPEEPQLTVSNSQEHEEPPPFDPFANAVSIDEELEKIRQPEDTITKLRATNAKLRSENLQLFAEVRRLQAGLWSADPPTFSVDDLQQSLNTESDFAKEVEEMEEYYSTPLSPEDLNEDE